MAGVRGFLLALLGPLQSLGIDPQHAKNITVFHVNEHKFGAIPVNMNTGDAVGDLFFDMLEVIGSPLICQNKSKHHGGGGPDPCANPEAVGADLMVNKLTLEVDTRFSGYGACNVGVNGSDPFGHSCKTDTYCCSCSGSGFPPKPTPCNSTVGFENVFDKFGHWMKPGCKPSIFRPHPTVADCYTGNVFAKLSEENPGKWYSTLKQGYCGIDASSNCTWRVVSVDKIVKRQCHTQVFGAAVAATSPACFESCGDQKTNTSSPCWVDCFYKAALGPDSGKPNGAVAGMSTAALVAAWQKPFLSVADGGCAPQRQMRPWSKDSPWFLGATSESITVSV